MSILAELLAGGIAGACSVLVGVVYAAGWRGYREYRDSPEIERLPW